MKRLKCLAISVTALLAAPVGAVAQSVADSEVAIVTPVLASPIFQVGTYDIGFDATDRFGRPYTSGATLIVERVLPDGNIIGMLKTDQRWNCKQDLRVDSEWGDRVLIVKTHTPPGLNYSCAWFWRIGRTSDGNFDAMSVARPDAVSGRRFTIKKI